MSCRPCSAAKLWTSARSWAFETAARGLRILFLSVSWSEVFGLVVVTYSPLRLAACLCSEAETEPRFSMCAVVNSLLKGQ